MKPPHNYTLNLKRFKLPRDRNTSETPCLTELVALLACWRTQGVDTSLCSKLASKLAKCSSSVNVCYFFIFYFYLENGTNPR